MRTSARVKEIRGKVNSLGGSTRLYASPFLIAVCLTVTLSIIVGVCKVLMPRTFYTVASFETDVVIFVMLISCLTARSW